MVKASLCNFMMEKWLLSTEVNTDVCSSPARPSSPRKFRKLLLISIILILILVGRPRTPVRAATPIRSHTPSRSVTPTSVPSGGRDSRVSCMDYYIKSVLNCIQLLLNLLLESGELVDDGSLSNFFVLFLLFFVLGIGFLFN
jgi:hypothetical protein